MPVPSSGGYKFSLCIPHVTQICQHLVSFLAATRFYDRIACPREVTVH